MTYAIFYSIPGSDKILTHTLFCFQYGEAYNYTVEDISKKYGIAPELVKIHAIITIAE